MANDDDADKAVDELFDTWTKINRIVCDGATRSLNQAQSTWDKARDEDTQYGVSEMVADNARMWGGAINDWRSVGGAWLTYTEPQRQEEG